MAKNLGKDVEVSLNGVKVDGFSESNEVMIHKGSGDPIDLNTQAVIKPGQYEVIELMIRRGREDFRQQLVSQGIRRSIRQQKLRKYEKEMRAKLRARAKTRAFDVG